MISRTQYISSAKSEKVVRRKNSINFPSSLKNTDKQTKKKHQEKPLQAPVGRHPKT